MATLQFVNELIPQPQRYGRRTREPNLEDVRTSACIAPLSLEFLQSRSFTWSRRLGCVLFRIDACEVAILVSGRTEVRFEFRSAFIKGYRVPEVSDATVGNCERETVRDQAD